MATGGSVIQFAQDGIVEATLHYDESMLHTYDILSELQNVLYFLEDAYSGDIKRALIQYVSEVSGGIDFRDTYQAMSNYPDLDIDEMAFAQAGAPTLVLNPSTRADHGEPGVLISVGVDDRKSFVEEAFEEAFMCQDGDRKEFPFGLVWTESQLAEVLSEIEMNGDDIWYVFDDGQERFLR